MRVCSIEDCGEPHKGNGFCNKHYVHWFYHGYPVYVPPTLDERFDAKWVADDATGCHDWVAYRRDDGYGEFRDSSKGRAVRAHRFAWERANGPIPEGLVIDHLCRNRGCVNVDHLRVVTPRVNVLENSVGPTAINAAKMVCRNGHSLSGDNLYIIPSTGYRNCRVCKKAYKHRWDQARRKARQSVEVDPYGQLLLAVG